MNCCAVCSHKESYTQIHVMRTRAFAVQCINHMEALSLHHTNTHEAVQKAGNILVLWTLGFYALLCSFLTCTNWFMCLNTVKCIPHTKICRYSEYGTEFFSKGKIISILRGLYLKYTNLIWKCNCRSLKKQHMKVL